MSQVVSIIEDYAYSALNVVNDEFHSRIIFVMVLKVTYSSKCLVSKCFLCMRLQDDYLQRDERQCE